MALYFSSSSSSSVHFGKKLRKYIAEMGFKPSLVVPMTRAREKGRDAVIKRTANIHDERNGTFTRENVPSIFLVFILQPSS